MAGADADNSLTVADITGSALATLNVNADAASVTVSTAADTTLAALKNLNLSTTTASAIVDVVQGQKLVATSLQGLTVNATAGNVIMGALGSNADAEVSKALTSINVTAASGADVTLGNLYLGTATAGYSSTLNTIALTAGNNTDWTVGVIQATGAAIGSLSLTTGDYAGTSEFNDINASSINAINVTVGKDGTYNFGDIAATTIGDLGVTVGSGSTVDFTGTGSGVYGVAGGTAGNITISGAGNVTLTANTASAGLVSVGLVDTSAGTGTYTITLTDVDTGTNMTGGDGVDKFTGTDAADNIYGYAGNDSLTGGAGADVIDGGAGDDTITGGTENDTITLGTGVDTVVFADTAANNGLDTISTFTAGSAGDVFDFVATAAAAVANSASGGVYTAIAQTSTAHASVGSKLAIVKATSETSLDTAAEVEALFAETAKPFDNADGFTVLLTAANDSTTARAWYVVNDAGVTTATLVGVVTTSADLIDSLTSANFSL